MPGVTRCHSKIRPLGELDPGRATAYHAQMWNWVKAVCRSDYYNHLDIVNCHSVLLVQMIVLQTTTLILFVYLNPLGVAFSQARVVRQASDTLKASFSTFA